MEGPPRVTYYVSEILPRMIVAKKKRNYEWSESTHKGVGGAGPPPEDPTVTRTPTTFGVSMGHAAQLTPPEQYTYGYPMHMPVMPMHQTNQHAQWDTTHNT